MNEATITIEGVSLIDFFGVNNSNFNILKKAFPKLKLIPRGSKIKVLGNVADIRLFEQKVAQVTGFLERYGAISPQNIMELVEGEVPTDVPENDEGIILYGPHGNRIRAKTPNQQILVDSADQNDILFAVGPAGTGKTYTAVALAVRALKNRLVKKIVLTRPAVEAGESLGFLPGNLKDKIDPYLRPLYDALDDMIPLSKLNYYMENRVIEIAPLAYMRGRTIDNAFIILDEAQNATNLQLKMFLTRIGPTAKAIITGDLSQIDLPRNQRSGLKRAVRILGNIKGIGLVRLTQEDVIRHRLVKKIIEAYEIADEFEQAEEFKRKVIRTDKRNDYIEKKM
ncbi:MAG: PhoH family protein [Chitinophagales bacterium]